MKQTVALIILDGWGIAPPSLANAISLANTPFMDKLTKTYPFMLLDAGGQTVGLPWGAIGNSEVGHSVIGAGRVIYQDLSRINQAILDGSFFENKAFLKAADMVKEKKSGLHLIGLVSGAGGHSYDKHLYSLLQLAKKQGVSDVFIHVILDGRDSPHDSGLGFVKELTQEIKKVGLGKIATISGRYFAMDRDKHWDRIKKAYDAMVKGESAICYKDPIKAIESQYEKGIYDEEFIPVVITDQGEEPVAKISVNDSVILFNFRPDRIRQLTKALTIKNFDEFERYLIPHIFVATMTQYDIDLPVDVAFSSIEIEDSLAEVISKNNLFQLHIAETEKYAHVTYFFNGGKEKPWPGEDNIIIPSPKVPLYNQKPAMSARKITDTVVESIESGKYEFIVINFANADIIGHTGDLEATVKSVEVIDDCIRKIVSRTLKNDGVTLITSDHGNAEQMEDEYGEKNKEHSDNPVPFMLIAKKFKNIKSLKSDQISGGLYDVAPTVLDLLNISQPSSMVGKSLLRYLRY